MMKTQQSLQDFDQSRYRVVTIADLMEFKTELFREIKLLQKEVSGYPAKQWINSKELVKWLGLSKGTLQHLRNTGVLPFTRIGSIIYYNTIEITKMMEKHTANKL